MITFNYIIYLTFGCVFAMCMYVLQRTLRANSFFSFFYTILLILLWAVNTYTYYIEILHLRFICDYIVENADYEFKIGCDQIQCLKVWFVRYMQSKKIATEKKKIAGILCLIWEWMQTARSVKRKTVETQSLFFIE